ncbi:S9 family peptidase [Flavobacterium saccharophilum]|uniref:Dipeptidyl aminopeptidase/acylaminoacyl peptidase n=1 Tax=Flavobacterium saccharophilum TaxID=29534 RepID=A0A1M7FLE0_9FLAO|nr:prolyl oligopeptidase family serine peptidase [Flavobacterium saccharophilum]SHM04881.1 Dipeptidyl aminopeptidase/acylaminoacyl peptidase [Flavobacterium saccharophilum]
MFAIFNVHNSKDFKSSLLSCSIVLFLFFILPLVTCPSWGQVVQKKQLTAADFHLWGEVHLDKISFDGKWASYNLSYENGMDTLFVRNISNNRTFAFAKGYNSTFTPSNFFICQNDEDLLIENLKSTKQETITGVVKYAYCPESNHLIYLIGTGPKENTLIIRSLKDNTAQEINFVTQFSLSPKGHQLTYATLSHNINALHIIDLKNLTNSKLLLLAQENQFKGITWQKEGRSVAFLTASSDFQINGVFYYKKGNDKLYKLDPHSQPNFPAESNIRYDDYYRLTIADDAHKVFFYIQNKEATAKIKKESAVEIWNANDKWISTEQMHNGDFEKIPKIALWQPDLGTLTSVNSEKLPDFIISRDFKYAILSNPTDYEPQFNSECSKDYYIMDLSNLEIKLFLQKLPSLDGELILSAAGKYIAYFKENNWWVYNIQTGTHNNITAKIGAKFKGKERTLAPESVCGSPGWSNDDKEILLYDQYDIWAVSPQGTSFKRLTRGREAKIRYRIAAYTYNSLGSTVFHGQDSRTFDLEKNLFLRANGQDEKTGFFKWKNKTGEVPIVFANSFVDELKYNSDEINFYFREQKFDQSPLLIVKPFSSKGKTFFKSNPQQQKYFWGRSELIEYENSKGQKLKGALFYPAGYDPEKKYPMIINIYEIQSDELHVYDNPSLYNENGFNISVFTCNGYFVFLPDIILEEQSPGLSATDCVISATKKIVEKAIIDPEKIGLMGHSFGGYESSFIITQTPMFAAAIASGAITDLNSFYHTVSQLDGRPDMWRFQSVQWNMNKTPYEALSIYNANSPIIHVDKISTPVLLWSGKQDKTVDIHQSLEYYLALRRLGKKSILLLYPNEEHLILKPLNQSNLTQRILQWFDYYLKDDKSISWINDGTK